MISASCRCFIAMAMMTSKIAVAIAIPFSTFFISTSSSFLFPLSAFHRPCFQRASFF
nr:MAG TPA_asm: hypothetical protein [Caudoviricetes sp.]